MVALGGAEAKGRGSIFDRPVSRRGLGKGALVAVSGAAGVALGAGGSEGVRAIAGNESPLPLSTEQPTLKLVEILAGAEIKPDLVEQGRAAAFIYPGIRPLYFRKDVEDVERAIDPDRPVLGGTFKEGQNMAIIAAAEDTLEGRRISVSAVHEQEGFLVIEVKDDVPMLGLDGKTIIGRETPKRGTFHSFWYGTFSRYSKDGRELIPVVRKIDIKHTPYAPTS